MAGKKDVVEQALKLIAGSAKEAAPKVRLPMDLDNRMYRASEMGFDPTRRYYHLTRKDFDAFKLGADPSSHTGGGAIWLREDPRYNISAHQVPSFEAEGARDIPLFIRPTKELPTMEWSLLRQQGKLNDQFPLVVTPEENKMLRDMGYSHASMGGETVVFDPKDLRSPHAVFDPDEAESADYMKSSGGSVRQGYQTKGRVIGDVVEQALKLTADAGEEAAPAMRYSVDEIPSHLKPGFKVDAAPGADAETRSLVEYLNQRDPNLAFDPQSLEERRQDLGVNVPAYHGSPRNISQFSNRYSNPEGYWGGHQYFTTSPVDASENYATAAGPDLTMRLEQEAENILENFHPNDVLDWHRDKYGTEFTGDPMDPKVVKQFSDDLARQNLGITNEGAVYPVNLRMKNPVVIDSPNQTFWPYDVQYDEDGDIISEGGPAADLVEKTRQALYDYGTRDSEVDRVSAALYDEISNNGGIDAKTYRKVVGENVFDLMDDNGNMVSPGHVMADVFQSLGYDSIDMATDVFAGGLGRVGMPGTGGSTRHYIVFDPKNIRSRFGAFDPFKASSKRISDADGGRVERADGGFIREGYAGKGRVIGDVIDQALKLTAGEGGKETAKAAKRAAARTTIKGSELQKKYEGLSNDPFGYSKFSKPLNEMEYTVEKLPMEAYKPLDPYDLVKQNALIAGHISDRTAAGRNLTNVGGTDLTEPLRQRGGADYQRTTLNAWANRPGAAKGLNRKLNEAAGYAWDPKKKEFVPGVAGAEEAPLYTTPVFMGASSANSSHMVGVPLIRMIPNLPISKADKLAFDAMMSERFPGWPGIEKTKAAENFMYSGKIPGSAITNFVKYAAAKKWKGAGFPDVEELMFASMDPRLVGVPQGSTGYGFKEFNPGRTPIVKTNDYHPDYPAAIPGKEYAGGFKYQVPQSLMLPDWWNSLKPELRDPKNATKAQHTLMTQVPIQRATPEWADKIMEYWEGNPIPWGYASGGAVEEDDDVSDALRIAKQAGGVLMEDAKGNKYDAQGNLIPPTAPGPNPARADAPQAVAQRAVDDPATYDALMQYYAVPDRDIMDYEATREAVAAHPRETQQMTHVGAKPRREVTVDMPLFGGEYSMGTAPYDVAPGMSGMAQTAYDLKTVPFYLNPFTAPVAAGMDVAEGVATNDPLTASLAIGFGPGGKYAKAAGIGAANYFLDPAEAEAGPARWFSKAMEAAQALPMEKMTGQQALAMLRKSVSPEELRWTGAEAFLPQQKQITKQDLVDYLAKNRVQTQDVVLGGKNPTSLGEVLPIHIPEEIKKKYRAASNAAMEERVAAHVAMDKLINPDGSISPENNTAYTMLKEKARGAGNRIDEIGRQMRQEYVDSIGGFSLPTKYQDYSTPGGQDYRETLIRLGSSQPPKVVEKNGMWHIVGPDGETMRNKSGGPYTYYSQADAERSARSLHRESGKFTSQHWNEPDVISHVRSQILDVTPEGANRPYKAFNVDETQSDWAQAGRKQGFKDEEAINQWKNTAHALGAKTAKLGIELAETVKRVEATLPPEPRVQRGPEWENYHSARQDAMAADPEMRRIQNEMQATYEAYQRHQANRPPETGVPSSPYIGSTQGWTDLSIKKSLDQALDAGADYFTFTPGAAQAERYNLQKHISKVQYNPDDGSLLAYDPNGKMVINESISDPSDLDEYIGKELADKMRLEEESRRSAIEEYEIVKDPETGEWGVYLYGEPNSETFPSKGHAKDYLNEMMANEFASSPLELSGLDLKTGGEGMIDYYNNIYKKRVEKVVKDATGQKVQWEVIPVQTADGPREQLGFRLTDDFQRARFSDFKKGGRVTGRTKYADSDTVGRALALTSEV